MKKPTSLEKLIDKLSSTTKKLLRKSQEHDKLNDLHAVSVDLVKSAYELGKTEAIPTEEQEKFPAGCREESMNKTIDLTDGDSVVLSLNGEILHIKANNKGTHFVVSTGDNDLSLIPDARNKIFISADTRKISVKQ